MKPFKAMRIFGSLLAALALAGAAQAGGDMADDDHDDGPSVFGFVKDGRGAPITGAKVTMNIKGGAEMATRSVANGMYKFERLNMKFDPKNVTISCSKDGYKQTRVMRRPLAKPDPAKPTEIECRMDKG
ncbi:MAG: carboxypeptidase-like regulatory domain-containing protein [Proteobacteria bacterium]|nr:carboxypeptidase-like regulatory domain-containing protein [Pseudomonadota bacterium]